MLIRCPACEHSRQVEADKIPARSEYATCPKCGHRFRFRALAPEEEHGSDSRRKEEVSASLPEPKHKDIWEAIESGNAEEVEKPLRNLGRLDENMPDYAPSGERCANSASIPWELRREGILRSFCRTVMLAIRQPFNFFARISAEGSLSPVLIFYIIFGLLQAVTNIFWWNWFVKSLAGTELAAELPPIILESMDFSRLPTLLLSAPFLLLMHLLLMSGLIHLMFRLAAPEAASFRKAIKVVGYAAVGMIFTLLPFFGFFIGPLAHLVLLFIGCRQAFGISWFKSALVLIPPYSLVFLLSVGQYGVSV